MGHLPSNRRSNKGTGWQYFYHYVKNIWTKRSVLLFIAENYLGYVFSQFREVAEVSAVKGKTDIETGDVESFVTLDR